MILSKKFISDYVDIDTDINSLAEEMVKVGNEYESVNKLINASLLTIGEVIECDILTGSDHLHACKVNIGSEILDIVCGAPNCRKGIKVIVALNGAVLPGGTINKTTILGSVSNGMLCSMAELGLDNKFLSETDIKGIHELPLESPIGEDPIKYLELDDEVIDFSLTANRADLLSMIGMSYEAGAILNKKVHEPKPKYEENNIDVNDTLSLNINTDNCYTFLVKRVNNIKIEESPLFIKNRLIACGIRPINNVVDISNYIMLETGQPLHFYDADKLGKVIGVRNALNKETVVTLDSNKRNLVNEDLIIINDKNEPIGLAGVMGGLDTEITNDTKNVVIESAIFNPYNIRYTAIKHLKSEASNRFEKGLDVNRTYLALDRACEFLSMYASGSICKGMLEYNTLDRKDKKIEISLKKINTVLGCKLSSKEVIDIFDRLGFKTKEEKNIFTVSVPTRRTDISIVEDLIEEVGRIYGVDNIEGTLPKMECNLPKYNSLNKIISEKLCSLGLNEVITYSLTNEKNIFKYTTDEFGLIKVMDPMTEERLVLRHSLINSLYEVYEYNASRNMEDINIYEIGTSFSLFDGNYFEEKKLSILMSGEYVLGLNPIKVDFYVIKGIIEELLDYVGYKGRYTFVKGDLSEEMNPKKSLYININGKNIGFFGAIHPNITNKDIYVMELNLDSLLNIKTGRIKYKEFSKYPGITKDLAFIIPKKLDAEVIINTIRQNGGKLLKSVSIFDYYEGEKIDKDSKSVAYSLVFECADKTLTEEEINPLLDRIIDVVTKKHKAILRDK